jgi:hypothetical protein
MNQQDFERLKQSPEKQPVLTVADLKNREPRSLVHGYTLAGDSFHVYLGEDGEIHVLTYKLARFPETATPTELEYMVVKYTHGPDGGVSSNLDFAPSKQAFPESCDFEFCEALKLRGVDIRFRMYGAREAAGRWVAEQFNPAAGAAGVEICTILFRREPKLTRQPIEVTVGLVHEAVNALKVPFAQSKQHYENSRGEQERDLAHIYVREQDADAVEALALQFFADACLPESDEALAKELVDQLFSCGEYVELETTHLGGGDRRIRVEHEAGHLLLRNTAQLVHYRGPEFGYCEKAASGAYRGRPFIATFHETVTNIIFSQFGAQDGFVERFLTRHALVPAGDLQ